MSTSGAGSHPRDQWLFLQPPADSRVGLRAQEAGNMDEDREDGDDKEDQVLVVAGRRELSVRISRTSLYWLLKETTKAR